MLPASKSSHPEFMGFTQQSGSATPTLNPFGLGPTSLMRPQKKNEIKQNQVDPRVQKYCPIPKQSATTPDEVEEEKAGQYNFVTLIDLFDEDDDLTTSFYGESPIRKSRAALSSSSSRFLFQDSRSNSSETTPTVRSKHMIENS